MQIRKSAPAWLAAPVSIVLLLGVLVPALGPLGAAPPIQPAGSSRAADAPPTPLLYSSAPDYPDAGLQDIVDSFVADAPGDWAVAIKKLDTGQYAEFNSHTQAVTASLYKVFVLYEVMRQRALGKFSLDSTEQITDADAAYDVSIGELDWNIGDQVKVSTLIDRMITVSDNTAAVALTDLVGADTINADLQRLGLRDSLLNFSGGDNMTTAADMNHLLEGIATSQVLDRDSCRYILDVMLKQELNDLLPQGLPLEVQMAHKTGSLFQLRHDSGIVYGPSGPYVITVMSWNQTDSVATYTVIPELSAAVYKYFNGRDFQPARYFPETRQVVGPAFLLYYNSHGGPATFGLPIAPETAQGDRVVQYFERARLERPAAGGPVTLGLIGRELTAAQGRAFPPTAQANPNDPDTQWFAATQQAIGQPFLSYWRQHGGEEIFGLPISPVVVEDHNGQQLRVQYFERARFELHGNTVNLGLVGSEVYALRK